MEKKNLFFAFAIAVLVLANSVSKADHFNLFYVTYSYSGPNQYILQVHGYHDCANMPMNNSAVICYTSASLGFLGSITLPQIGPPIQCLPGFCYVQQNTSTTCNGGSNYGMEEFLYQDTVTLPQAASDWIFSFTDCCIYTNTLSNNGTGYYVYATLDNLNFPVNNSPSFLNPPYPQCCVNSPSTYLFSAIDPDGDSLSYSLESAEDGFACPPVLVPVVYIAPYSPSNPISSSVPINLDPVTGVFSFTPNLIEDGYVSVLVSEYRNGLLVGSVKREDRLVIVNGNTYLNGIKGTIYYDQNSNQVYDPGDIPVPNLIVERQPGAFFGASDYFGKYTLPCSTGTFTSSLTYVPPYFAVSPQVQTATFSSPLMTDTANDFALNATCNANDAGISILGMIQNLTINSFNNLNIHCVNHGTVPFSGYVRLIYDSNYFYTGGGTPPDSISGNELYWNIINLSPFNTTDKTAAFQLQSVPSQLVSVASILPIAGDTMPLNNTDTLSEIIPAALPYDPNLKTVSPGGGIPVTLVNAGIYLEYSIHFQNTGNAPAINVMIRDTLDANLNIPTFEVLNASHLFTWTISGNGIIEFHFDNINLPDSNTNELLSHGFIKYRVKLKSTLVPGDKAINSAAIYFDSNPAILTNSVSTTVLSPLWNNEWSGYDPQLVIYPNPANAVLFIEVTLKSSETIDLCLYNLMGEALKKQKYNVQTGHVNEQIDVSCLSFGIYLLKVTIGKGSAYARVVIGN